MVTSGDINFAALMNIVVAAVIFVVFALLRIGGRNEQVYFPKWKVKGLRTPLQRETFLPAFGSRNFRAYLTSFYWIPAVLGVPEQMLIHHAGLDSAVYLRIYSTGLKILVPICVIVFVTVVPVNYTNDTMDPDSDSKISGIDKLSILNVHTGSTRFWTHIIVAYAITLWTCYVLKVEYETIASMRMDFIAAQRRRPSRYTVLVRNVPSDSLEPVSQQVENFFKDQYPDHYLSHKPVYEVSKLSNLINEKEESRNMLDEWEQKYAKSDKRPTKKKGGCLGCKREDAIDFYKSEIERLNKEIVEERLKVIEESGKLKECPAAFVFFKTGWGAGACAQRQQTRSPKVWLTELAPEPSDVCWENLAFLSLPVRKLWVGLSFGVIIFLSTLASAFIISYITLHGLEAAIPGFRSVAKAGVIRSFIRSILPQIPQRILQKTVAHAVKIITTKFLRPSSKSATERKKASGAYILLFINSFLLILIPADGYHEILQFFFQSPFKMAKVICRNLPEKDSYFIVYVMWSGTVVAREILRWEPFRRYHLSNWFRTKAEIDSDSLGFEEEPEIQFFLLLALVYALVSPLLLVSVNVFLALSYLVYRNQFINVYNQEYESAAAYWPDVHGRIIVALLASHLLSVGFLNSQKAYQSTPLLLPLPLFTIGFYNYCKTSFEPVFRILPIQEELKNDASDQQEPDEIDLTDYLTNAYTNPAMRDEDEDEDEDEYEYEYEDKDEDEDEGDVEKGALETGRQQASLVLTKHQYVSARELRMMKTF